MNISWFSRTVSNIVGKSIRNMSVRNSVFIYNGEGAVETPTTHLKRSLEENLSTRYDVKFITPEDILQGTWTRDAALMAFGGGFDKGFIRTLGTAGVEKIRSYVLNGGKYLGICAGGYFACDYIEFDKGGPLEVCGQRHLKFFPGCGKGPVYPGFRYNSLEGSKAVPVNFSSSGTQRETILTYFHGGGSFLLNKSNHKTREPQPERNDRLDIIRKHLKPNNTLFDNNMYTSDTNQQSEEGQGSYHDTIRNESQQRRHDSNESSDDVGRISHQTEVTDVDILSQYIELPGTPPAIVRCRVGQGIAVLCGVHIEYIPSLLLQQDSTLEGLVKTLEDTEHQRLDCFRGLLKHLDLEVNINK